MLKKLLLCLIISISAFAPSYAIDPPASLSATYDLGDNSVALTWPQVPSASGYNVYRKQVGDTGYSRINFSLISVENYKDRAFSRGGDHLYVIRAVDPSGAESPDSASAGAPLMTIDVKASVTTNRSRPLEAKSIKTGKLVTFAAPGDMITYSISYANKGCSSSKNVSISYDIPSGTVIAGAPRVRSGPPAEISYFDKRKGQWVGRIGKPENIARIKFLVNDPVPPISGNKKINGSFDLNVMISL